MRRTIKGPVFLLPSHCELTAGAVNVTEKQAAVKVYRWDLDVDQERADEAVSHLVEHMYDGRRERITVPDFYLGLAEKSRLTFRPGAWKLQGVNGRAAL